MTHYAPKGSMCMECAHRSRDCSRLPFSAMPPISSKAGYVIVRCTHYLKATP